MSEQLEAVGIRIAKAICRFSRDHDFGIMWEYDDRKAGVVVGPNALAGFPFATGQVEHLDRLEAIAAALEMAADQHDQRIKDEARGERDA